MIPPRAVSLIAGSNSTSSQTSSCSNGLQLRRAVVTLSRGPDFPGHGFFMRQANVNIDLDSKRRQTSSVARKRAMVIPARLIGTWCRVVAFTLASALLAGCAVKGSVPETEQVSEKLDAYVIEDDAITHNVEDQDVAKLWQESEILRRSGDFDSAKSRLQQAIDITPRDAVLWSRAAELELEQSSHLRAENYAAKSNFLASVDDTPLRYRNWLIIQRSREGRGDLLGAREAEIESTRLNP